MLPSSFYYQYSVHIFHTSICSKVLVSPLKLTYIPQEPQCFTFRWMILLKGWVNGSSVAKCLDINLLEFHIWVYTPTISVPVIQLTKIHIYSLKYHNRWTTIKMLLRLNYLKLGCIHLKYIVVFNCKNEHKWIKLHNWISNIRVHSLIFVSKQPCVKYHIWPLICVCVWEGGEGGGSNHNKNKSVFQNWYP